MLTNAIYQMSREAVSVNYFRKRSQVDCEFVQSRLHYLVILKQNKEIMEFL